MGRTQSAIARLEDADYQGHSVRMLRKIACALGARLDVYLVPREASVTASSGGGSMPRTEPVVTRDPEIMGGTPVFAGTRVPVQALIDYLEAGDSLDEFLEDFPSVSREQTLGALEIARDALTS